MVKQLASLFIVFIHISLGGLCQEESITILGKVQEGQLTEDKSDLKHVRRSPQLNNVEIVLITNQLKERAINTENKSFYELHLKADNNYRISFKKDGYIPKMVEIDTHNMTQAFISRGYELFTDITLFRNLNIDGLDDYNRFPVAKCSFNESKNTMVWDMEYAENAFKTFIDIVQSEAVAPESDPSSTYKAVVEEKE